MSTTQYRLVGAFPPLLWPVFTLRPVEEILSQTQTKILMKIYNLPVFALTLEFLIMLALSTGRLLKVSSFLFSMTLIILMQLSFAGGHT
jgi:hypothetical protein